MTDHEDDDQLVRVERIGQTGHRRLAVTLVVVAGVALTGAGFLGRARAPGPAPSPIAIATPRTPAATAVPVPAPSPAPTRATAALPPLDARLVAARTLLPSPGLAHGPWPANEVAVGFGSAWVASAGSPLGRVLRIDLRTARVVADIPVAIAVDSIAVSDGSVWAAGRFRGTGPYQTLLVRVDPRSNLALESIAIPVGGAIAATGDAVWVPSGDATGGGQLRRVDARTLEVTAVTAVGGVPTTACGGVGVLRQQSPTGMSYTPLDPATGRPLDERTFRLRDVDFGLERALGRCWAVGDEVHAPDLSILSETTIVEVEPVGGTVHRSAPVDTAPPPTRLATVVVLGDTFWTARADGRVQRVDPVAGTPLSPPVVLPDDPDGGHAWTLFSGGGAMWAVAGDALIRLRLSTAAGAAGASTGRQPPDDPPASPSPPRGGPAAGIELVGWWSAGVAYLSGPGDTAGTVRPPRPCSIDPATGATRCLPRLPAVPTGPAATDGYTIAVPTARGLAVVGPDGDSRLAIGPPSAAQAWAAGGPRPLPDGGYVAVGTDALVRTSADGSGTTVAAVPSGYVVAAPTSDPGVFLLAPRTEWREAPELANGYRMYAWTVASGELRQVGDEVLAVAPAGDTLALVRVAHPGDSWRSPQWWAIGRTTATPVAGATYDPSWPSPDAARLVTVLDPEGTRPLTVVEAPHGGQGSDAGLFARIAGAAVAVAWDHERAAILLPGGGQARVTIVANHDVRSIEVQ